MNPSLNSFRRQCINYLLARGWEQDVHDSAWGVYRQDLGWFLCDDLGYALDIQMEWDDNGPA
jgi:hypothetical protein